MFAKYIDAYYCVKAMLEYHTQEPDSSSHYNNKSDCQLVLHWSDLCSDFYPCSFLLKLNPFFPIVINICRYLTIYQLIKLYVELDSSAYNWLSAIKSEVERRNNIFNWLTTDYTKPWKTKSTKTLCYSDHIFGTSIEHAITFYDYNCSNYMVRFSLPEIKYTKLKQFEEFIAEDLKLFVDIRTINISMNKLKFINNECKPVLFHTLYFPSIPDIQIKSFDSQSHFPSIIGDGEEVICLLIFMSSEDSSELGLFLNEIGKRQTISFPISGSFCVSNIFGSIIMDKKDGENNAYVAFTKKIDMPVNFFAASIVISNRENFKHKLMEFKNGFQRRQQEFILCFVCCGKKKKFLEINEIQRTFHDLPVFYMEVNGEIGNNCYLDCHREAISLPKRKKVCAEDYVHAFTSVLMYISWGKCRISQ